MAAARTIPRGTMTLGTITAGDDVHVLEGPQDITGSLDNSGTNELLSMDISAGYAGSLGTSAGFLKTTFSGYLYYAGTGHIWFQSLSGTGTTTALVYSVGGGHFHLVGGGTVTRMEVVAGEFTAANEVTITTLRIGKSGRGILLDSGSGAAVGTLDTWGMTYSQRPHTTVNLMDGMLTLDMDSNNAVNAHGTINIWGGRIKLRDSGTVTNLKCFSSIPDISSLTRAVTITDATINTSLPGWGAFRYSPLLTFTNAPTLIQGDGRQQ